MTMKRARALYRSTINKGSVSFRAWLRMQVYDRNIVTVRGKAAHIVRNVFA